MRIIVQTEYVVITETGLNMLHSSTYNYWKRIIEKAVLFYVCIMLVQIEFTVIWITLWIFIRFWWKVDINEIQMMDFNVDW